MITANVCTETVEGEQAFVLELWRGNKKVSAYLNHEINNDQIIKVDHCSGNIQDALTLHEALKWLMEGE